MVDRTDTGAASRFLSGALPVIGAHGDAPVAGLQLLQITVAGKHEVTRSERYSPAGGALRCRGRRPGALAGGHGNGPDSRFTWQVDHLAARQGREGLADR